jgi:hypothetical protein
MDGTTPVESTVFSRGATKLPANRRRLGAIDVLFSSLWCGLAAGLLEVGIRTAESNWNDISLLRDEPALRLVGSAYKPDGVFWDRSRSGPLISIAEDKYVFIRNEGDGKEELYNEQLDPRSRGLQLSPLSCY